MYASSTSKNERVQVISDRHAREIATIIRSDSQKCSKIAARELGVNGSEWTLRRTSRTIGLSKQTNQWKRKDVLWSDETKFEIFDRRWRVQKTPRKYDSWMHSANGKTPRMNDNDLELYRGKCDWWSNKNQLKFEQRKIFNNFKKPRDKVDREV